jgi:ATP-dependent DNA ligase
VIRKRSDLSALTKKQEDASVLTGQTMKQIAKAAAPAKRTTSSNRRRKPCAEMAFIDPMMAKLVTKLPIDDWNFEIKFDGWRAIAICQ